MISRPHSPSFVLPAFDITAIRVPWSPVSMPTNHTRLRTGISVHGRRRREEVFLHRGLFSWKRRCGLAGVRPQLLCSGPCLASLHHHCRNGACAWCRSFSSIVMLRCMPAVSASSPVPRVYLRRLLRGEPLEIHACVLEGVVACLLPPGADGGIPLGVRWEGVHDAAAGLGGSSVVAPRV